MAILLDCLYMVAILFSMEHLLSIVSNLPVGFGTKIVLLFFNTATSFLYTCSLKGYTSSPTRNKTISNGNHMEKSHFLMWSRRQVWHVVGSGINDPSMHQSESSI